MVTVERAARVLSLNNSDAAKALARWRHQGWLTRVKRGLYVAVPVDAATAERALDNAWILIPDLFGPAYVGGWSAAEHWDLTEQIFRDICVFTARPITKRHQLLHNIPFVVTHAALEHHFGTKPIWTKDKKILVSDPAKTMVDMLSEPWTGGGIQHVAACLSHFFKSDQFNSDQVVDYATRLGNGAVFKRLGYLAQQMLGATHSLTAACEARLSKGNAQLDPALKGNRLITRWHLFLPKGLSLEAGTE